MRKVLILAAIALVLVACGGCQQGECSYELRNDFSGEVVKMAEFPANVYPTNQVEYGNGLLAIKIADPRQPEMAQTVIVPACKRNEVFRIIAARQAADAEQREQGIPFEQRTYP